MYDPTDPEETEEQETADQEENSGSNMVNDLHEQLNGEEQ